MSSVPKGTLVLGGIAGIALLARYLGRKWADEKRKQEAIAEEFAAAPPVFFERSVEGPEAFWEEHFSEPRRRLEEMEAEKRKQGLWYSPLKRGKWIDASMSADANLYKSDPDKFWKVFWATVNRAGRQTVSHMA